MPALNAKIQSLIKTLLAHASRHQDAGADEIDVTGLSGLLADDQHVLDTEVISAATSSIVCNEDGVICHNNEIVYI